MKNILNWITNIVLVLVIAVFALNMLSLFQARQNPGQMPNILGFTPLTVLSGSMSPAIETGDMVIISNKKNDLKAGDVITYKAGNIIVTHRIIEVTTENNAVAYITQGDANNTADSLPVLPEQILGKYKFRIPYIGYLQAKFNGWMAIALVMGLMTIYCMTIAIKEIKTQKKKA